MSGGMSHLDSFDPKPGASTMGDTQAIPAGYRWADLAASQMEGVELEQHYRETLRLLRDEIERLTRTVRGLLALARLDRSGQALEMAPVALARLAEAEVEAVRPAAEARGLALRLTAEAPGTVLGHEPLLRDVVRNLLDNAIKYTEAGEVAVRVEEAGDAVRLVVSDTGPGIPAADLPNVTARFHRARAAQRVPGSGLGLALVAPVVRQHGGTLDVASEPGHGTTVTVALPRHRTPAASEPVTA
jgi:signal transduction histidine kinase